MATAPSDRRLTSADETAVPLTGVGRDTGRLKRVPEPLAIRQQIRAQVEQAAATLDKSRAMARHEMESHAGKILAELDLPDAYLGWTMVALASAFWRDQVAAVPHDRRLLLLPHCLRRVEVCPAKHDAAGLLCEDCGACSLTKLRADARRKGYRVLIAEGSPTVMKIILGGHVDAVLGVSCLDVLEKTLDKVLLAGIPCMAVPLLGNGCRNTATETDSVRQMIDTPHRHSPVKTRTYVHLMRCAAQMFEPAELTRLVPPARSDRASIGENGQLLEGLDPIACTEAIAYDFLAAGGKHSRPFITLAVYDALTGGAATEADGAEQVARLSDAVRRIALAIEVFHKASLVHDDIEDNDEVRYDRPTLHRRYGTPTAINVGDYLIGLGYRLVAGQRDSLPADMVADLSAQFADAHTKLCEGQGAELIWRRREDKRLQPIDALKIYALKTAPAFEAALMAGVRLAGPAKPYREAVAQFARHLGVAYQILNDLDDWQAKPAGGRRNGGDLLGGRPTVLWALAMQRLGKKDQQELETLTEDSAADEDKLARADQLYRQAEAYDRASALVAKHHQRAQAAAAEIDDEPFRNLLHFLADAILDRRPLALSENVEVKE